MWDTNMTGNYGTERKRLGSDGFVRQSDFMPPGSPAPHKPHPQAVVRMAPIFLLPLQASRPFLSWVMEMNKKPPCRGDKLFLVQLDPLGVLVLVRTARIKAAAIKWNISNHQNPDILFFLDPIFGSWFQMGLRPGRVLMILGETPKSHFQPGMMWRWSRKLLSSFRLIFWRRWSPESAENRLDSHWKQTVKTRSRVLLGSTSKTQTSHPWRLEMFCSVSVPMVPPCRSSRWTRTEPAEVLLPASSETVGTGWGGVVLTWGARWDRPWLKHTHLTVNTIFTIFTHQMNIQTFFS